MLSHEVGYAIGSVHARVRSAARRAAGHAASPASNKATRLVLLQGGLALARVGPFLFSMVPGPEEPGGVGAPGQAIRRAILEA